MDWLKERKPMDWLINLYGLKPWGDNLLYGQAHFALKVTAIILTAVLAFEFLAWGSLANCIAHNGAWEASWKTIPSFGLGLIPAIVVWIIDRSIMTLDTDYVTRKGPDAGSKFEEGMTHMEYNERRKAAWSFGIGTIYFLRALHWKFYASLVGRVGLVLISALITAAPVELFVFDGEINQRIYDEAVIAEAVRLTENYNETQEAARIAADTNADTLETDSLARAESHVEAAEQKLTRAEAEVTRLRGEIEAAKDLARIKRQEQQTYSYAPPQALQAKREAEAAERMAQEKQELLEQAKAEVTRLEAEVSSLRDREFEAEDNRTQRRDDIERSVLEMQTWMDLLARGDANNLPQDPKMGLPLNLKGEGFVMRLSILNDILDGRPPRWPPTDEAIRLQVEDTFPGVAVVQNIDTSRNNATAEYMSWVFLIMHIVVIVIPLATVLYKLLLPQELKDYYSKMNQAISGNEDAEKLMKVTLGNDDYVKLIIERSTGKYKPRPSIAS
jgi:hypothetical protein